MHYNLVSAYSHIVENVDGSSRSAQRHLFAVASPWCRTAGKTQLQWRNKCPLRHLSLSTKYYCLATSNFECHGLNWQMSMLQPFYKFTYD